MKEAGLLIGRVQPVFVGEAQALQYCAGTPVFTRFKTHSVVPTNKGEKRIPPSPEGDGPLR